MTEFDNIPIEFINLIFKYVGSPSTKQIKYIDSKKLNILIKCPYCTKKYKKKKKPYLNHINKCKIKIKQTYKCKYCGKIYKSIKTLNTHEYKCNQDPIIFSYKVEEKITKILEDPKPMFKGYGFKSYPKPVFPKYNYNYKWTCLDITKPKPKIEKYYNYSPESPLGYIEPVIKCYNIYEWIPPNEKYELNEHCDYEWLDDVGSYVCKKCGDIESSFNPQIEETYEKKFKHKHEYNMDQYIDRLIFHLESKDHLGYVYNIPKDIAFQVYKELETYKEIDWFKIYNSFKSIIKKSQMSKCDHWWLAANTILDFNLPKITKEHKLKARMVIEWCKLRNKSIPFWYVLYRILLNDGYKKEELKSIPMKFRIKTLTKKYDGVWLRICKDNNFKYENIKSFSIININFTELRNKWVGGPPIIEHTNTQIKTHQEIMTLMKTQKYT